MTTIGFVHISGPEAKKFLQGQLTCDMEQLVPEQYQLAAHCNPQGRIISLFHLFQREDAYYFVLPASMVEKTILALKKYIVFFKAAICADVINIQHADFFGKENLIQRGIPSVYPETSGLFLPHELNLPDLGAVSFNKGCYTGQEIIARMHYRGKLKSHLYQATFSNTLTPTPGSPIVCENNQTEKTVGTVVDAASQHILFVTDETNAKDAHLFLPNDNKNYFKMRN
jgi:folate-binding protein YgfZ